jgi:hypothetical protein
MIMDKDNSKSLELDEVAAFLKKIFTILFDVIRKSSSLFGRNAITMAQTVFVNDIFLAIDRNGHGMVTPDELFSDFPPVLLEGVTQLPDTLSNKRNALVQVKRFLDFLSEIGTQVLGKLGAIDKEAFFKKWKALIVDMAEEALETFKSQTKDGSPLVTQQVKNIKAGLDGLKSVSASFLILVKGKIHA